MEQDFQTSFIPKKPILEDRAVAPRPISLFNIVSIFILFTMLVVTGGLFFYRTIVRKQITDMQASLNAAKHRFEPAKIAQLQVLDKRLKASTEILAKHVALTPIFTALERITMKSVRFTKFSYAVSDADQKILVKMNGQAVGYRSVALQSDLFAKNKYLIDPIFSNLSLDDKGNVLFELNFSVDPTLVDYQQMLKTLADQSNNPQNAIPSNGSIAPLDTTTNNSNFPSINTNPTPPYGATAN